MSNVKCLKLVTGEDLIAEYSNETGVVKLTNPVQISMVPSRTGTQPTFGFIPFPLTTNDKEINIPEDKLMFICEPAEEFLNQYNQLFSNIVTPPKGLII